MKNNSKQYQIDIISKQESDKIDSLIEGIEGKSVNITISELEEIKRMLNIINELNK